MLSFLCRLWQCKDAFFDYTFFELPKIIPDINDEIIKNAHSAYSSFSADDYMLEIYEAREKRMKDEFTNLEGAREEGEQIGIAKGEQIGIAKGKLEGKIETAKQMYKLNLPEDVIQKATGLSKEELKKIK